MKQKKIQEAAPEIEYVENMIAIADSIPAQEAPHQLKKAEISALLLIAKILDSIAKSTIK